MNKTQKTTAPRYFLDTDGAFVIENYNCAKPFVSFFPGVAGVMGGYLIGVAEIGVSMATLLQYTSTGWMAIWGIVFFKEAATVWRIGAVLMALLKLGREAHSHKPDNLIDAAGYIGLAADMAEAGTHDQT